MTTSTSPPYELQDPGELCHRGGHAGDHSPCTFRRGKCEALRMWQIRKEHLEREAKLLQSSYSPDRPAYEDGGVLQQTNGVQAAIEAQETETKRQTGRRRELQSRAT